MPRLISWLLLLCLSTFTYGGPLIQGCYWREYCSRIIPDDAVEIHNDGKYVGQVYLQGGLIPATIYPYLGYAITDLFGKKVVSEQIKILACADHSKLYWEYVDFNRPASDGQMKNAVFGGFYKQGDVEFNYFIGKLLHLGEWKVGRVISPENKDKGLFLWTDGTRDKVQQFYMLKYHF